MKQLLTIFAVIALSPTLSLADQCAWTSQSQAASNARIIERMAGLTDELPSVYVMVRQDAGQADLGMKRYILAHNESHRAGADSVKFKVATLPVRGDEIPYAQYREVQLTLESGDTVDIDAAYTFIETAPNVYTNLAFLTNCPTVEITNQVELTTAVNEVIR